jgi:hypothetical protein
LQKGKKEQEEAHPQMQHLDGGGGGLRGVGTADGVGEELEGGQLCGEGAG